jgi:hypothetical protein
MAIIWWIAWYREAGFGNFIGLGCWTPKRNEKDRKHDQYKLTADYEDHSLDYAHWRFVTTSQ